MAIEVRKMLLEDIEQVLRLCDEVREYHRNILNGYFAPQNDGEERATLTEMLEKENMLPLVAFEQDKVLGMLLADKRVKSELENQKIAHIFNFGVFEESRGKGIAKLLMDVFYEECKKEGIKEIKLGVFNKNIGAYKFYQKYGFEDQEQRMSLKVK